jgi:DNA helicase-2/ATP-dependent DNA helicase PcrA
MAASPDLLSSLNEIQQQAVKATEGPILVLAGAGSGKTRVLTYKVAYLMAEKKIQPENILVVTFTNKAAGEMKERIIRLVGSHGQPIMGTFHSICSKLLRREGHVIGLKPGFSIYDEADAMDAIKQAMANLNIPTQKTSPGAIRHTISGAKNELISDMEYPQYARGFFQETVAKVYLEYAKILRQNQALDFDDLLLKTIQLFQAEPTILARYQIQFQYILVDEYQDTNAAQYKFIQMLAKKNRNLCVVGDASQAIYGFRGADFRNIVNFKRDYAEAKVFNLEQNYRSTQVILDAAHAVISENKTHPILKLWTKNNAGLKITVFEARNEVEEAAYVADIIAGNQTKRSDYSILYRTNAQSRSMEEVFLKRGIPYKLVGGVQFYERKEIKDILAYLKLISNPSDSVAQKRIEKIGKGRAQRFMDYFMTLDPTNLPPTHEMLDSILTVTDYLNYLDDGTEQGKMRIENVKELASVAEEFPELTAFLENVALIQDNQMPDSSLPEGQKEAVTLMTLHASKGLEFPVVFIVGMEEGLFPHSRSMLDQNQMEEERRLAYVGITRAKQKLYLTYTRSRLYFGTRSNNLVSRFIGSLPQDVIEINAQYRDQDSFNPSRHESFDDDVSNLRDDDDWLNS